MATVTLQNSIRDLQNENKLSAAAYIKAYRPWHSLYNVRLRLETNSGEEVSAGSMGQSYFSNPWSGSCRTVSKGFKTKEYFSRSLKSPPWGSFILFIILHF